MTKSVCIVVLSIIIYRRVLVRVIDVPVGGRWLCTLGNCSKRVMVVCFTSYCLDGSIYDDTVDMRVDSTMF